MKPTENTGSPISRPPTVKHFVADLIKQYGKARVYAASMKVNGFPPLLITLYSEAQKAKKLLALD